MTKFFKKPKKSALEPSGCFLPTFGPKLDFPGVKDSVSFSIFELSTIVPKIRKI